MKKLNWGHGVIIALGSFMIFVLSLIIIFPIGKQNADLISNNYYEEELEYQTVIDGKKNASLLADQPKYEQLPEGIKITFPESILIDDNIVDFILFRTEDSNLDVKKQLSLQNRVLLIPSKVISKGSYTLKIKWTNNKKPYQIDYDIIWK